MNGRTALAVKNIGASVILKGGSILISFFLVPLTLGYLNAYEYGIWLTLNSVLSWVYLLDLGLGNGLRNKLTEAIAKNDFNLGRIYVSTSFFFMTLIVIGFYTLFLLSQQFLDWYAILNVDPSRVGHLNSIVTIVFAFVCLNFLLKMIGNIYMSFQLPAVNDMLSFIGSSISLCVIFILTKTTDGSLMDVAATFSGVPAIVYIVAYPLTFRRYPKLRPAYRYVKKEYFRELISLGVNFFLIQIAVIVLYMSSNVLISNLFGPEEVTPYNIAFKLFSVVSTVFTIIVTPVWSSVTDAFTRNDIPWIKRTIRHLLLVWGGFILLSVCMVILSPWIYRLWIGDKVHIPMTLTVLCAVYMIVITFTNVFISVINGLGKLRVQLIAAFIQSATYIPLAILLGRQLGVAGIIGALIIVCLITIVWSPYQCIKLLRGEAKGIWNK